jgi:hypothetical protein
MVNHQPKMTQDTPRSDTYRSTVAHSHTIIPSRKIKSKASIEGGGCWNSMKKAHDMMDAHSQPLITMKSKSLGKFEPENE